MSTEKQKEEIFVRDKFEIFMNVIIEEFERSKYDSPIILADIMKMGAITNEIFGSFNYRKSIKENVEVFYAT